MSTQTGQPTPVKSGETRVYKNGLGYTTQVVYGSFSKPAIYALLNTFKDSGWECEVANNKGTYTLTASRVGPEDGSEETPVDRWTWKKELLTKSIWTLPAVDYAMSHYFIGTAGVSANEMPRLFKEKLEKAAGDGPSLVESDFGSSIIYGGMTEYQIATNTVLELRRGAESYETDYLVVTRQRTTTPEYTPKIALGNSRVIYTTAQLNAAPSGSTAAGPAYPMPTEIVEILPSAPATGWPANSTWGWRERVNEGQFEGLRFVQTHEWTFAAWSTFLYETGLTA